MLWLWCNYKREGVELFRQQVWSAVMYGLPEAGELCCVDNNSYMDSKIAFVRFISSECYFSL